VTCHHLLLYRLTGCPSSQISQGNGTTELLTFPSFGTCLRMRRRAQQTRMILGWSTQWRGSLAEGDVETKHLRITASRVAPGIPVNLGCSEAALGMSPQCWGRRLGVEARRPGWCVGGQRN